jgi:hypothetical protein
MPRPNRREFLQQTVAGWVAAGLLGGCAAEHAPAPSAGDAVQWDPADPVAAAGPSQWAIKLLRQNLAARNSNARVIAAGSQNALAQRLLGEANVALPDQAEALAILPLDNGGTLAVGNDPRGLVYALTELTEAITSGAEIKAVSERPANRIRGMMRLFVSDVEDKGWFHDREFWNAYLTMLATERFNRFNLALGLGYDAARQLRDTYFFFAYPFLLDVPGYSVRASPLSDAERDRNLQTLRFISDQAALRGIHFQLGLWTHGFVWTDSPQANYVIEGLTADTQAAYCRDALHMLLEGCPSISGVTLRVHGESGVPEGSYDFWETLFGGIAATGRKIEIDMHGKGMDQRMIDVALGSGLPVTVSPKFWAEHMGLPYMQSSIRAEEMPRVRAESGPFALSNGSRSFLRYSYGDLLKKDRRYRVLHRVWPGTQRLLLWGDPTYAAAYGRLFSFCGTDGVEYFDPLSFKGRKGSGLPGGRDGYADASLRAVGGDWVKYLYNYRLLGRLSYNPDCDAEVWRRQLRRQVGRAAGAMEKALGASSRILPLILSAHDPSAANARYWPEMYTNMSMVNGDSAELYPDTPRPRVFSLVSSLDPQMFATVAECADALLAEKSIGKYTPLEVAEQLDQWADAAAIGLDGPAANRRMAIDATISAGLGRFFAAKFRAGVWAVIFDRTKAGDAQEHAVKYYQLARLWWARLSETAGVYAADITYGPDRPLRGHWGDRLAAIDRDIAELAALNPAMAAGDFSIFAPRPEIAVVHVPPARFGAGEAIALRLSCSVPASARLWYRHVNQAENYRQLDMKADGADLVGAIPADYADSPFHVQYYFEIRETESGRAVIYPGLGKDFAGCPYFVVQQS